MAAVLGLEELSFGDSSQTFYVLGLSRGKKLLIPIENLPTAGVRALVSPDKAHELLEQVTAKPTTPSPTFWRERAASHADGLRTGDADKYTEILQQLLQRARAEKLSATDQHTLQVARTYFLAEISAVLDEPVDAIEAVLKGESLDLTQETS